MLLSACCQTLFPIALRSFASSFLLLLIWLCAAWSLRRSHPARRLLLHQSALCGVGLCLLLTMLTAGAEQGVWKVRLPVGQQPEDTTWARQRSASSPAMFPVADPPLSPLNCGNKPGQAEAKKEFVQVQAEGDNFAAAPAPTGALTPFKQFIHPAPTPFLLTAYGKSCLIAVAVWGSVALLLLGWLAVCYAAVYRIRRRAAPAADQSVLDKLQAVCAAQGVRAPALLVSKEVKSVFLIGLFRPAILLPTGFATESKANFNNDVNADFDAETLDAVFAHEAAHLRAREAWWTLAARVLCAVCWMQPLVWWLCREREQAAEEDCDQAVLERGCSPQRYAACLLRLAQRLMPTPWECAAGSGSMVFRSSLGRRIQHILHRVPAQSGGLPKPWRMFAGMASVFLAAFLSLMVSAQTTQMDTSLTDNPRLNQKVIVSAEGVPMGDLLALLSQKTGVPLKADGFTTDDKVIVFGPARPLRDFMADLAALFNDTWLHSRDGNRHSYRLTRNPRERDYETTLSGEMNRRLLAQMEAQVRALEETPAQFARRPATTPSAKRCQPLMGGRPRASLPCSRRFSACSCWIHGARNYPFHP